MSYAEANKTFITNLLNSRKQRLGNTEATAQMVDKVNLSGAEVKWGIKKTPSYLVKRGTLEYEAFEKMGYITSKGVWGWKDEPLPVNESTAILTSIAPHYAQYLESLGYARVIKEEEGGVTYDKNLIWTNDNFVTDGEEPTFIPLPQYGSTAYAKVALVFALSVEGQNGALVETTEGSAPLYEGSIILFEFNKEKGSWVPYVQHKCYFEDNYKIV